MFSKNKNIKKCQKLIYRPDAFYRSYWFTKFINKFMRSGKKQTVEKIVMKTCNELKLKTRKAFLHTFFSLLMKVRPLLGLVSKRFGKQFKKIPVPLYPRRQTILALKWLVTSIKVNRLNSLEKKIMSEFFDFTENRKTSLSKRYADHLQEVNENRLNHRFRWK